MFKKNQSAQQVIPAEVEWEYETFVDIGDGEPFDIYDWLNHFGKEGWELVQMIPKDYRLPGHKRGKPAGSDPWTYIFKRPVDRG